MSLKIYFEICFNVIIRAVFSPRVGKNSQKNGYYIGYKQVANNLLEVLYCAIANA